MNFSFESTLSQNIHHTFNFPDAGTNTVLLLTSLNLTLLSAYVNSSSLSYPSVIKSSKILINDVKELGKDAYSTMRPALSLWYLCAYLLYNDEPKWSMAFYFSVVYPLCYNACNDYVDWDHDENHSDRTEDLSRGKCCSRERLYTYYFVLSMATLCFATCDPFFVLQYIVIIEGANILYHGMFLGFHIKPPGIAREFGFPLDIIAMTLSSLAPNLMGRRTWVPNAGLTILVFICSAHAQLKDYDYEKGTTRRTMATCLGGTVTKAIIAVACIVLCWVEPTFAPCGLYRLARFHPSFTWGKISVITAVNMLCIVCFRLFEE